MLKDEQLACEIHKIFESRKLEVNVGVQTLVYLAGLYVSKVAVTQRLNPARVSDVWMTMCHGLLAEAVTDLGSGKDITDPSPDLTSN